MSVIVRRTNPDPIPGARGARWRCCACKTPYDDEGEARTCAETDHATGRHKRSADAVHYEGFDPTKVDLNAPPCQAVAS